MIKSVQTSGRVGRYNLASPGDEQYHLELRVFMDDGSIVSRGETFSIDEQPDLGWGDDPLEVLNCLDARAEEHWIDTARDEKAAKSTNLHELMDVIRAKWIDDKVRSAEQKLEALRDLQSEVHGSDPEIFYGVRDDLAALTGPQKVLDQ